MKLHDVVYVLINKKTDEVLEFGENFLRTPLIYVSRKHAENVVRDIPDIIADYNKCKLQDIVIKKVQFVIREGE